MGTIVLALALSLSLFFLSSSLFSFVFVSRKPAALSVGFVVVPGILVGCSRLPACRVVWLAVRASPPAVLGGWLSACRFGFAARLPACFFSVLLVQLVVFQGCLFSLSLAVLFLHGFIQVLFIRWVDLLTCWFSVPVRHVD